MGDARPNRVFGSQVTIVGDAAHAHGDAFAAGGSLALDDSLALGLAFKEVFSSSKATFSNENINKAFGLYSQTRQPHTARLLGIVRSQIDKKGTIFATHEEEVALVARMTGRPSTEWLLEHGVEAAFTAVVERLEGAQRHALPARKQREMERFSSKEASCRIVLLIALMSI